MIKITLLIALANILLLTTAQPDARTDINGVTQTSTVAGWTCTVKFNDKGTAKYTETLNADDTDASNALMNPLNSDNLDSITWSGTSCDCYVIVFQDANYDGASLGVWLGTTNGTIDLTDYVFLDDKDIITRDDYYQWNEVVSSYHIYCY